MWALENRTVQHNKLNKVIVTRAEVEDLRHSCCCCWPLADSSCLLLPDRRKAGRLWQGRYYWYLILCNLVIWRTSQCVKKAPKLLSHSQYFQIFQIFFWTWQELRELSCAVQIRILLIFAVGLPGVCSNWKKGANVHVFYFLTWRSRMHVCFWSVFFCPLCIYFISCTHTIIYGS